MVGIWSPARRSLQLRFINTVVFNYKTQHQKSHAMANVAFYTHLNVLATQC